MSILTLIPRPMDTMTISIVVSFRENKYGKDQFEPDFFKSFMGEKGRVALDDSETYWFAGESIRIMNDYSKTG